MVAAAAIAVGSVAAGAMGASASKKAAKTAADAQTAAANQNAQLAREQRDMMRGYVDPLVPYAGAGASALASRVGLGNGSAANPFASATPAKPAGGMAGTSPVGSVPNFFATAANDGMAMNTPGAGTVPANVRTAWDSIGASNVGAAPAAGGTAVPQTPAAPQANAQAFLQQWPDLAAEAANVVGPGKQFQTPEQYLEWHDDNFASEPRQFTPPAGQQAAAPAPITADGSPAPYGFGSDYTTREMTTRPEMTGSAPSQGFAMGDFFASPDYKFRYDEAMRGANAAYAGRGLLKSDAAVKGVMDRGSNLASAEYGNWFNRQMQKQQADRGQWNTDRDVLNRNYDLDATRGDARYDADRNFSANRFDQQTNNIFGVTGIGTGAINTLGGVGTNYANSVMGSNSSAADAIGNAAIAGANSTNNLFGQAAQAIGNVYANSNTNLFSKPPATAANPYYQYGS